MRTDRQARAPRPGTEQPDRPEEMLTALILAASLQIAVADASRPAGDSAQEASTTEFCFVAVDREGAPIAAEHVDVGVNRITGSSTRTTQMPHRVLEGGAVALEVARPDAATTCSLEIRTRTPDGGPSLSNRVLITAASPQDLGVIVLWRPLDPTRWTRLDDDALEGEWRKWTALRQWNEVAGAIGEMGRRGGNRWIEFLDRRAARAGSTDPQGRSLAVARARRIARGLPDPLCLAVEASGPLVCRFPDLPRLRWRLVNVDPWASLPMRRSGHAAHVSARLLGEGGRPAATAIHRDLFGGGRSTYGALEPQASIEGSADLSRSLAPARPGRYSLVLAYEASDPLTSHPPVPGPMAVTSRPFVVTVEPRTVRISRDEHERHLADARGIDLGITPILTRDAWRPDLTYPDESVEAYERLYRAGWNAAPALLQTLEESANAPRRRDWMLALLADITGVMTIATGGRADDTGLRVMDEWPWSIGRGSPRKDGGVPAGTLSTPESAEALRELWLSLRPGVRLVLVE